MARRLLRNSAVKLQLTKTKTVELSLPSFGGGSRQKGDVTGVELSSGRAAGCPAVRICRKKDGWHLAAAGFVPPPDGEMPTCWDEISRQPSWELPRQFQASGAALAVSSPAASFGQSSAEAIVQEMMRGEGASPSASASPAAGNRRLAIKRAAPAAPQRPVEAQPRRRPEFPAEGEPVSENGRRFVVRPFAEEGFHISASIPEYQALWLGRLLPEGRRPTACSIQLAESALMASVSLQPEFTERGGSAVAMMFRDDAVFFAGYKKGVPALWRRCPGFHGYTAMREAVKKTLGVGDDLVDSVLEESLVDPRPALEPLMHPVMEQLELARAYLSGKHGLDVDRVILLGLPCGAVHWKRYAEETLHIQLVAPGPFEGLVVDKDAETAAPHVFLTALGAALAAAEAAK